MPPLVLYVSIGGWYSKCSGRTEWKVTVMRLIDADALKDYFTDKENPCVIQDMVLEAVDVQPTIDAEPVKHGRWEFKNNGRYGQTRCYCTACGKHSGIGGIRENRMKPYCPNCGANMKGE